MLFTDIEGSTRLLRELGSGLREALAEHRRVLREAFARTAASRSTRRATRSSTRSPTQAAAGGRRGRECGASRRADPGPDGHAHGRAAPSTDEGYVGEDVHLAARVAAAGHGGQVLFSKATGDLVDGGAADLGEHRLKDFDEPVAIFQLGEERFPPLKTISNTNLPRPASSLRRPRAREVEEVVRCSRGARLVTLTGPGGSGRRGWRSRRRPSSLAGSGTACSGSPLATLRDPALVLETIAQTLGAEDGLADHIGEQELLLLLDNLEQVIDAAPELADLARGVPEPELLVTCRELLRVRGEVEYEVLPLASRDGGRRSSASALRCRRAR